MKRIPKATVTKAIKRLVRAEINDSWKGASGSLDYAVLEQEVKDARTGMDELIRKLIANQRDDIEDIVKGLKK